jgi:phosphoglucan,water dikinase
MSDAEFGGGSGGNGGSGGSLYDCAERVMDYSRHPLSQSGDARVALGRRMAAVASCMEQSFGGAQDVEGCFVGDELFVVQTRPQP